MQSKPFTTAALYFTATVGLVISLYLFWTGFTRGSVTGCGGGPCDELLSSRWASLFRVPVALIGAFAYTCFLLSQAGRLAFMRTPLAGLIAGSILWFVVVQALIVQRFCPWCMTAHAAGAIAVGLYLWEALNKENKAVLRTAVSWSGIAFIGLAFGQLAGPAPKTYRLEGNTELPSKSNRVAHFYGGRVVYNVGEFPRIGSVDAERVIVEYFDYQCAACRTMAGHLDELIRASNGKIAVLLMPSPLDRDCNSDSPSSSLHPGSCEISRIALAVWRSRPDTFAGFHKALMEDASVSSARKLALEIVSRESLQQSLSDPWIEECIRSNIATLQAFSKSTNKLPKLLVRDSRILHGLPATREEFLRVIKQELAL